MLDLCKKGNGLDAHEKARFCGRALLIANEFAPTFPDVPGINPGRGSFGVVLSGLGGAVF